jgi:hypothetical protein
VNSCDIQDAVDFRIYGNLLPMVPNIKLGDKGIYWCACEFVCSSKKLRWEVIVLIAKQNYNVILVAFTNPQYKY